MNEKDTPFFSPRVSGISLCILFLVLVTGLDSPPWDQDESAYFGFSLNMHREGKYRIPEFPLSEPHRKTPLHFWIGSVLVHFGGEKISILRLGNLVFFLFTIILVYAFYKSFLPKGKKEDRIVSGKVWNADQIAIPATLVFSTGIFLPLYSRIFLTDIPLLFYSLLGIWSLWNLTSHRFRGSGIPPRKPYGWVFLFWVSVSLGVLQKGPPILVLLGGIAGFVLLFSPNRKNLLYLHPWLFFPLALLPFFLWGKLAWTESPEFIRWLVDWYILKRTTGSVFGQTGPPGYYLLLFLFFFFPWSYFLPGVTIGVAKKIKNIFRYAARTKKLTYPSHRTVFQAAWFFSSYLFYELVPSKLPSYVLGFYPLLSLWLARAFVQVLRSPETDLSWNERIFYIPSVFLPFFLLVFAWQMDLVYDWSHLFYFLPVLAVFPFFLFYLKYGISKWNKNYPILWKCGYWALLLGMFCILEFLYFPPVNTQRDYGRHLAQVLLEISGNRQVNTEISSGDNGIVEEIANSGGNGHSIRSILIHPEIRLPSIPLALWRVFSDRPHPLEILEITGEPGRMRLLQPGEYLLIPWVTAEIYASLFSLKPKGCVEFFSYESGKKQNLCWMEKSE